MWNATIGAKELANISSYQTLWGWNCIAVLQRLRHRVTLGYHIDLLIWSHWKPEAGGDHGVGAFFRCPACMCCWLCCAQSDGWLILVVSHCLSVGYFHPFFPRRVKSSTYLGFSIKKYSVHSFLRRWLLSFRVASKIWSTYVGILIN